MTSQDWFNPSVQPPTTLLAAPSTAPTSVDIRPVLYGSHSTPLLQGGGGYLTDQQMLNPTVLSPVGPTPSSSPYGGADQLSTFVSPLLKGGRRTLRKRGGGYGMPGQWYTPDAKDPVGITSPLTTAASPDATRPVLVSTFVSPLLSGAGRREKTRKQRGGFSPSVMGSFAANAQAAIVPLVLYGVYKLVAPEKQTKTKSKSGSKSSPRK